MQRARALQDLIVKERRTPSKIAGGCIIDQSGERHRENPAVLDCKGGVKQSRMIRKVRGLPLGLRKITSGFSHIRIVFQTCPPLLLVSSTERETSLSLSSFTRLPSTDDFFFHDSRPLRRPLRRRSPSETIQNSCSNTVSPLRIVALQFPAARRITAVSLSFSSTCFSSSSLPLPFSVSFLFWFCNPFYETSVARTRWWRWRRVVEASGTLILRIKKRARILPVKSAARSNTFYAVTGDILVSSSSRKWVTGGI